MMASDLMAAGSAAGMLVLYTLLSLLAAGAQAATGDGDASVVSMEGDGYNVLGAEDVYVPLKCRMCYRSVHGEDCVHMLNTYNLEHETCEREQKFCAVEWMKTDNELTTFSRGCAATCVEGCVNAGDKYQRCHKCCEDTFCNDHLGSEAVSGATMLKSSFLIAIFTLSFIHTIST